MDPILDGQDVNFEAETEATTGIAEAEARVFEAETAATVRISEVEARVFEAETVATARISEVEARVFEAEAAATAGISEAENAATAGIIAAEKRVFEAETAATARIAEAETVATARISEVETRILEIEKKFIEALARLNNLSRRISEATATIGVKPQSDQVEPEAVRIASGGIRSFLPTFMLRMLPSFMGGIGSSAAPAVQGQLLNSRGTASNATSSSDSLQSSEENISQERFRRRSL